MNYEQLAIDKRRFINMTLEQEAEVQRLIKDIDVTELMDMLKKHGNRYSRRILKFFRWFCKYVPINYYVLPRIRHLGVLSAST